MNLQLDWERSGQVYPEGYHPDIGENENTADWQRCDFSRIVLDFP